MASNDMVCIPLSTVSVMWTKDITGVFIRPVYVMLSKMCCAFLYGPCMVSCQYINIVCSYKACVCYAVKNVLCVLMRPVYIMLSKDM